VENSTVDILYTPTQDMAADGLTKALEAVNHRKFVTLLGMKDKGTVDGKSAGARAQAQA
jgi:hypothetical protein